MAEQFYSVPIVSGGKIQGSASADIDSRISTSEARTLSQVDSKVKAVATSVAIEAASATASSFDAKIEASKNAVLDEVNTKLAEKVSSADFQILSDRVSAYQDSETTPGTGGAVSVVDNGDGTLTIG